MKAIIRKEAPACLKKYKNGRDNWDSISFEHKQSIKIYLDNIQGDFCAYCESSLDDSKHIEHFANKNEYPKMTFSWNNLFLSCGSSKHCGHFKDSHKAPKYSYLDLIKPDIDASIDFFVYNSNGRVSYLKDLNQENLNKAMVSVSVFNLNEIGLVNRRSTILAEVEHMAAYIYSLADSAEIAELLTCYKQEYQNTEFSAAKLQLLLPGN